MKNTLIQIFLKFGVFCDVKSINDVILHFSESRRFIDQHNVCIGAKYGIIVYSYTEAHGHMTKWMPSMQNTGREFCFIPFSKGSAVCGLGPLALVDMV